MTHTHCPVCYEELEVVETTPCIDCGASERSINLLNQDIKENYKHDSVQFSLYRAFEEIECVICDLCTLEFTSYNPEHFGFKKGIKMWPSNFQFLKHIEKPVIVKDKYCNNCNERLAFILFTLKLREINNA